MKKKKMLTLVLSAAMALTTFAPVATNAAPVCAHPEKEWKDQVDATCQNTTGIRGHYECVDCELLIDEYGKVFDNYSDFYYTIEEGGHKNRVWLDEVAETCTTEGMAAHYKCVDCDARLASDDENAYRYTLADVTIPVNPTAHTKLEPKAEKVEPTCVLEGKEEYWLCANGCGKVFNDKHPEGTFDTNDFIIPATGVHTKFKLFNGYQAPTCETVGYEEVWTCNCGAMFSDKHPANGVWPADFTIPALGHNLGELIAEVPATCTDNGVKAHYVCTNCDAWFDETETEYPEDNFTLAATGHKRGKVHAAVTPTCTEDGHIRYYECKNCDAYLDKNAKALDESKVILPATGHHKGQHVRAKAPTCVRAGRIDHYRCADCSAYLDKNGNVLAREEVIIPADAKYHHYNDGVCTICGDDLREITVIFKDKRGTRKVYTVSKGGYCKVPGTRDVYNNPSKNTWKCSDAKLTVKKNAYVDFEDLLFADFDENGKATVTFVGNYKYK